MENQRWCSGSKTLEIQRMEREMTPWENAEGFVDDTFEMINQDRELEHLVNVLQIEETT